MPEILIGIDPGVITGISTIHGNNKVAKGIPIHKALLYVSSIIDKGLPVHIRIEDARQRKWFGENSAAKKQGAGSVKRDCKIWEDFLIDLQKQSNGQLTFEMVHPIKGGTKINSKMFKQISGITSLTNEHARDAYMLIHGFKIHKPITPKPKLSTV